MRESLECWGTPKNTITSDEFKEKMEQVAQMWGKIAIIKVNDVVGFGVIALEDIPENTLITFYAGQFMKDKRHTKDNYSVGHGDWKILAKFYLEMRNLCRVQTMRLPRWRLKKTQE